MPEDLEFRLIISTDKLDLAQEAAEKVGADLTVPPQPEFIDPITAVFVGAGALLVAKFVIDYVDRLRGGVIINLDPDAEKFSRRDSSIPGGWILIVDADGTSVKIETRDAPKDAAERLLEKIIDGAFKTVAEVAKAATKALGQGKVKEAPEEGSP